MLSKSEQPAHDPCLDQFAEELLQLMDDAEATGIDSATLLHRAIILRESRRSRPSVPILDQLVQQSGWLTKACSG